MKKAIALLLLIFVVRVPPAIAHPEPPAHVVVDLDADTFLVILQGDIPALVMQAQPGHLGDERAEELRAMTDKELQGWVEDARKAFALRMVVAFDGQPARLEAIEFPALADIRRSAVGHNEKGTEGRILCRGRVPKEATTVTLTFPQDVGRVLLTVRRGNEALHSLRLAAGQTSPALALTSVASAEPPSSPSPVGPVLVLIGGVAVFCLIAALRRRVRSLG